MVHRVVPGSGDACCSPNLIASINCVAPGRYAGNATTSVARGSCQFGSPGFQTKKQKYNTQGDPAALDLWGYA